MYWKRSVVIKSNALYILFVIYIMFFSKKYILLLIIIIFFTVTAFYVARKYYQPTYKGRGYCAVTNEYIPPKLYDNFISPDETKHILQLATPLFRESRLVADFRKIFEKVKLLGYLHRILL